MTARRRGLGRGLEALLEQPGASGPSSLPLASLRPNRLQPRSTFDDAGLEELAASIRAHGVVQPIIVTDDGQGAFTIVAGERRWRAARRAGLEEVPVVVREVADDRQLLEMALVENLQRSDLNPIEEGEAYLALGESFGLSHEEIARQVGKGRTSITNARRLLRLEAEVQDLLREGRLTAGQARPLVGLAAADQLRLARQAVDGQLSARRIEELVAGRPKKEKKRVREVDADTAAAAEKLTRRLQTRVEIRRRGRGGSVRIHFHSEEELIRLFDLLVSGAGGQGGGRQP